jgi:hypothetical protein
VQEPGRRRRWPVVAAVVTVAALALVGCTGEPSGSGQPAQRPSKSGPTDPGAVRPGAGSTALFEGLDVCSLATPAQVRRVTGQPGEPSSRLLTRVAGYGGLTDQCGYGVSFDSFTMTVDVGLVPAGKAVIAGLPGRPAKADVSGIGQAARAAESPSATSVAFVKGATFVQVRAVRGVDVPSPLAQLTEVARQVAAKVPSEPPASDAQVTGACAELDGEAVAAVLGGPAAVSRSLVYKDRSSACSFGTGVDDAARYLTLSLYTNRQLGPFLADQKSFEPTAKLPGVEGDAFTVPGTAYLVADDGQAVGVTGLFGRRTEGREPLPPTPELAALLQDAAGLLT